MCTKAFTLVELIVVITILAILGTIAFISLQGYSKEARDSKRIQDTRNLIGKINIESMKGATYKNLIKETTAYTGQILGAVGQEYQTFGKANFENLKENSINFKDPSTGMDYPLAYAVGGSGRGAHGFVQVATISEKDNQTRIMGNYYVAASGDIPSLFTKDGAHFFQNNGAPIYGTDGDEVEGDAGNPGDGGDATADEYLTSNLGGIPEIQHFPEEEVIAIADGNGGGIIIMDKNLGASEAGTGEASYGDHYQWGRNIAYPQTMTATEVLATGNWETEILGTTSDSWTDSPCPAGYHVPTKDEWQNLHLMGGWGNNGAQMSADLKLPLAGTREALDTNLSQQSITGHYWTSTSADNAFGNDTKYARYLYFNSSNTNLATSTNRDRGFALRCFKN